MLDCDTAMYAKYSIYGIYLRYGLLKKEFKYRDYNMLFKTLNNRIGVNNNSIINVGTRYGWL
jgi:hypothetical protein